MSEIAAQHKAEVRKGDRFEFGKNWSRFLATLNDRKIELAEASLRNFLGSEISGKRFVDIGSGSGLFSLAARRLGAKVHSFDYDSDSFACTCELRRRYFKDDPDWTIEQASALDTKYLSTLGQFDIVYSWGVLHHTGSMWPALANVKPLVPIGGQLFIAIYNDQGEITDEWARIKARYNRLSKPLAFLYALGVIGKEEGRSLQQYYRGGDVRGWLRNWKEYETLSVRGMNRWHDWIDWIGGHPYERATVEEIIDFYSPDGFRVTKVEDRTGGIGCNEFVFRRVAGAGTFIENPVPGGSSMSRQYGSRVLGPFEKTDAGWVGQAPNAPRPKGRGQSFLLRGNQLVGPVEIGEGRRVVVAPAQAMLSEVEAENYFVIAAEKRELGAPFPHRNGRGWWIAASDLGDRADNPSHARHSDVFVFEDGIQLPHPHAMHHEINEVGGGRFSHWGDGVHFSPSRPTDDPNSNGRSYSLLYRSRTLAGERSLAKTFGRLIEGPFERSDEGWLAKGYLPAAKNGWLLVKDDCNTGALRYATDGRFIVADADTPLAIVEDTEFYAVDAREMALPGPFVLLSDKSWSVHLGDTAGPSDSSEAPTRSTAFLFQNGRQLPQPHALHAEIASEGAGRYSHWGTMLYFSTLGGDDPNEANQHFSLVIPATAAGS